MQRTSQMASGDCFSVPQTGHCQDRMASCHAAEAPAPHCEPAPIPLCPVTKQAKKAPSPNENMAAENLVLASERASSRPWTIATEVLHELFNDRSLEQSLPMRLVIEYLQRFRQISIYRWTNADVMETMAAYCFLTAVCLLLALCLSLSFSLVFNSLNWQLAVISPPSLLGEQCNARIYRSLQ